MTPDEKIQFIQKQCDAIWDAHKELPIDCPYCYRSVQPGEGPCCELMDKAIRAIVERARAVEEGMALHRWRERHMERARAILGN